MGQRGQRFYIGIRKAGLQQINADDTSFVIEFDVASPLLDLLEQWRKDCRIARRLGRRGGAKRVSVGLLRNFLADRDFLT
jgi:hypothetical protein